MHIQTTTGEAQASHFCEGGKVDFKSDQFEGLPFLREVLPFLQGQVLHLLPHRVHLGKRPIRRHQDHRHPVARSGKVLHRAADPHAGGVSPGRHHLPRPQTRKHNGGPRRLPQAGRHGHLQENAGKSNQNIQLHRHSRVHGSLSIHPQGLLVQLRPVVPRSDLVRAAGREKPLRGGGH